MDHTQISPCPHAKKCGGCQLQHLSYEQQLRRKQGRAIALLGRFGHVEPILGMDDPLHYRNKVHAAFALDSRRKVVSGIYQPGSHAVVPVDACDTETSAFSIGLPSASTTRPESSSPVSFVKML